MSANHPDELKPAQPQSRLAHLIGFGISGGLAFLVDVAVTKALIGYVGAPAAVSRVIAIAVAMVVAWACHRRLTFALRSTPTIAEFLRYASMGWSAAALNYSVFIAALWLLPGLDEAIAIAIASAIAMAYSYVAMRMAVFKR
jgi:putative flippase GtrA